MEKSENKEITKNNWFEESGHLDLAGVRSLKRKPIFGLNYFFDHNKKPKEL